jgi:hypothetical protein
VSSDAHLPKPNTGEWAAHFWEGCDVRAWLRLLARNRCAIHWSKLYIAASVSFVSIGHTILRHIQDARYGPTIRRLNVRQAPVFILGHWRSGTTLLHELLIADPRHAFPTTYECLAPHHFLISESWLPQLVRWMLPAHRPMDNMAAGWERPQEDEFAMCLLGQPSPYARIAFPNTEPDDGSLELSGLSRPALANWKRAFLRLIRELSLRHGGRRLILKSPPHTCRIPTLLELFPDARFIHIMRDPYVLYPSTMKLWRALFEKQGLQRPTFAGLDEYVLSNFERMYGCVDRDRPLVSDARWFEVRYEDLIQEPLPILERLYSQLDLGNFAPARAGIEKHLSEVRDFVPSRHVLNPAERATITRRWGEVIRRYGYPIQQ